MPDLLSFDNISHYIKELIDINYINIDKDLQEFFNIEQSDTDLNIINENYDLLTEINIFAEFTFENNQIKPSAILQYAIKILILDAVTPTIIFNQQILDYFINKYLYKNEIPLLLKLYRHRDFNKLKIGITFDYLKKYDQMDDIKNLMNNPLNFHDMLTYKADYNKFIKWLFKNSIFIDWLTTIFGYIYNNDIKNIYKLMFFTSDKIEEFLNHYTQYNDNQLTHEGFRI